MAAFRGPYPFGPFEDLVAIHFPTGLPTQVYIVESNFAALLRWGFTLDLPGPSSSGTLMEQTATSEMLVEALRIKNIQPMPPAEVLALLGCTSLPSPYLFNR